MRFAIIVTIAVSIFLMVGISIAQKGSQKIPDKPKNVRESHLRRQVIAVGGYNSCLDLK